MLKTMLLTIIAVVLSPIYTFAYLIAHALRLKDVDLMETPLDFITIAIDDTAYNRYVKKLTKQVENFYNKTPFIPRPAYIILDDAECLARVIDDVALIGDSQLYKDLTNL